MLFTDIRLQNYRSYDEASFELGLGVNIVIGPNGAGKTSLLEAIMVAATGGSYKARDELLVREGADWSRLDVHTNDNKTRVIKLQRNTQGKIVKTYSFDDKDYKILTHTHKQPVVLFQPDDLRLFYDQPVARRDYIDNLLEQLHPSYGKLRKDLRRVVAQRNALLKRNEIGSSQLFAWNIRLSEIAGKVVTFRRELVGQFNVSLAETYSEIASKKRHMNLLYVSKTDPDNYVSNLMRELEASYELDKIRGFTGRGPHRDDIQVVSGDQSFSDISSRGENRTLILAMKVIELRLLEEKTGLRPILLLDDVFSELDGTRRQALTQFLMQYQTVITTTDADIVTRIISGNVNYIAL